MKYQVKGNEVITKNGKNYTGGKVVELPDTKKNVVEHPVFTNEEDTEEKLNKSKNGGRKNADNK